MGIVGVKEIPRRPKGQRKSKFPFTPDEVQAAIDQLKKAGQVGCGPYDPGNSDDPNKRERVGRSAAQRLKNLVAEASDIPPERIKTTAWEDDKGVFGALVLKEA